MEEPAEKHSLALLSLGDETRVKRTFCALMFLNEHSFEAERPPLGTAPLLCPESAARGGGFRVRTEGRMREPARGGLRAGAAPPVWVGAGRRTLTSGCFRRMCLLMEALVDTLVPHSWQLCASTLSWVSCTCFWSMYSVTYFLSHTEHVHCLPTSHTRRGKDSTGHEQGHPTVHRALCPWHLLPASSPRPGPGTRSVARDEHTHGLPLPEWSPVTAPSLKVRGRIFESCGGLTFRGRGPPQRQDGTKHSATVHLIGSRIVTPGPALGLGVRPGTVRQAAPTYLCG